MGQLVMYSINKCPYYHVFGRTTTCHSPLTLFWGGSGVEWNVKASEFWINVESDYDQYEQWICILINGAKIARQMLVKGKQEICIFRHMNPDKVKNVRIIKEVQAMPQDQSHRLQIHAVYTDGEFQPIEKKSIRLEVIGDSITSCEGVIGAYEEEDWISMIFSSANGYPWILANTLDADLHIISQSGWGVLCAWDNNPHGNIPSIYDKVCGLAYGDTNQALKAQEPYDFSSWQPDYIVVNLGTNDGGAFYQPAYTDPITGETFEQISYREDDFDAACTARFEQAVVSFLYQLRSHNPSAQILWCYGMLGNQMKPYILNAIKTYQQETADEKVCYIQLTETSEETKGSRQHPGVKAHEDAANTILQHIFKLQ